MSGQTFKVFMIFGFFLFLRVTVDIIPSYFKYLKTMLNDITISITSIKKGKGITSLILL